MLGAGIVTVLDAGFDNVQQFLTFGYIVSLIVTLLALAYLAFRTLRGMPLFLAIALLLTPFVAPPIQGALVFWGSPIFVLPLGISTFAALWWSLRTSGEGWQSRALLASAVGGLASTVWTVFLPVVAAGLLGHVVARLLNLAKNGGPPDPFVFSRIASVVYLVISVTVLLVVLNMDLPGENFPTIWRAFWAVNVVISGFLVFLFRYRFTAGWRRVVESANIAFMYVIGAGAGWAVGSFIVSHKSLAIANNVVSQGGGGLFAEGSGTGWGLVAGNFGNLAEAAPLWTALLMVTLGLVTVSVVALLRKRDLPTQAAYIPFGLTVAAAIVLGVVGGLKQGHLSTGGQLGTSLRYLGPVAVATVFGLAWTIKLHMAGHGIPLLNHLRRPVVMGASALFLSFIVVSFGLATYEEIQDHNDTRNLGRADKAAVDGMLEEVALELGREPKVLIFEVQLQRPSTWFRDALRISGNLLKEEVEAQFPNEQFMANRSDPVTPADLEPYDLIITATKWIDSFPGLKESLEDSWVIEDGPEGTRAPLVFVRRLSQGETVASGSS